MGLLGDHCTWKIIETRIDRSRPKKNQGSGRCRNVFQKKNAVQSPWASVHHLQLTTVVTIRIRSLLQNQAGATAETAPVKRSEAVPSGNLWLRNPWIKCFPLEILWTICAKSHCHLRLLEGKCWLTWCDKRVFARHITSHCRVLFCLRT